MKAKNLQIMATVFCIIIALLYLGLVSSDIIPTLSVTLNSTSGKNYSSDNLTVFTNLDGNSSFKLIYNWFKGKRQENMTSFSVLNIPMEGGKLAKSNTKVKDYSNSLHASIFKAIYNSSGGYDNWGAYEFDGSSSYLEINDNEKLNITPNLTISVWIKSKMQPKRKPFPVYSLTQYILEKGEKNSDNYALFLKGDEIAFGYYNTSYHVYTTKSANLRPNTWYHIAVTISSTKLKFFKNGVKIQTQTLPEPISPKPYNLFIGKQNYPLHPSFFNGTIDELLIFDKTLSENQIYSIYKNNFSEIVSNETSPRDIWKVEVTANNGTADGKTTSSKYLLIKPRVPRIIIDGPRSGCIPSPKLTTRIKILTSVKSHISYSLNGKKKRTICKKCSSFRIPLRFSSFGNHKIMIYANNSNSVNSTVFSFRLCRDTDNDKIPDSTDPDDDNDGINDTQDFLNGGPSNVLTNLPQLNLSVGNSYNHSQAFKGVKRLKFISNKSPVLEFNFNFSSGTYLNLADVILEKQSSNDTIGKVFVRGINLTSHYKKTIYLDNLDPSKNSICIKDAPVESIDNITYDCTSPDEIKIKCDGTNQSGYTCTDLGSKYMVTGLSNSLIIETFDPPESSDVTPAENGRLSCISEWSCSEWSECFKGKQNRTCKKINATCISLNKPTLERSCKEKETKKSSISLKLLNYKIKTNQPVEAEALLNNFENGTILTFNFIIKNEKNKEIFSTIDSIKIKGANEVLFKSFRNLNLLPGKYSLDAIIVINEKTTKEYTRNFEVIAKEKNLFIFMDILVIAAFLLTLGILNLNSKMKKRFKAPIIYLIILLILFSVLHFYEINYFMALSPEIFLGFISLFFLIYIMSLKTKLHKGLFTIGLFFILISVLVSILSYFKLANFPVGVLSASFLGIGTILILLNFSRWMKWPIQY